MQTPSTETAKDLFLSSNEYFLRTNIPLIDDHRLISPSQILYIDGYQSIGKTEVALRLIASTILPVDIGGNESQAVYFDLDRKFSMIRLLQIVSGLIVERFEREDKNEIVLGCVRRLWVCKPEQDIDVIVTLRKIANEAPTSVKLIILDQLSNAMYWQQRVLNPGMSDNIKGAKIVNANMINRTLFQLQNKRNIAVVVVRKKIKKENPKSTTTLFLEIIAGAYKVDYRGTKYKYRILDKGITFD